MATGDQTDFINRIKLNLPPWFGTSTPFLDGLLSGFSWCGSFIYGLIQYAKNQTRIATMSDDFLDLLSSDFFGTSLPRYTNEGDTNYRARILIYLFRERGTRNALNVILTAVTGRKPLIFEPWNTFDTGGYSVGGIGYDVAGGYGAVNLNNQVFVTAYRQSSWGIPYAAGYGNSQLGYGVGSSEYGSLSNLVTSVSDSTIYAAVENVRPVGNTIWVKISN